jgi:hypothetical protein
MKELKTYKTYGIAGGTMGTTSRKYNDGFARVYSLNGFTITKFFNTKGQFKSLTVKGFFIDGFNLMGETYNSTNETIDWKQVNFLNNTCKNDWLKKVMAVDITSEINQMKENEEAFKYFLNHYQTTLGFTKAEAFKETLKMNIINVKPLATEKIMMKYGHDFKTANSLTK